MLNLNDYHVSLQSISAHRFQPIHVFEIEGNVEQRHEGIEELKLQKYSIAHSQATDSLVSG